MTKPENLPGYRSVLAEPVLVLGRGTGRQGQSCLQAPRAYVEQHTQVKDLW